MRGVIAGALLWSIVSSLTVVPHSLSYFNELVGGPKNGHRHLANSNTDWGQDLFYVKRWYDENAQARPLGVSYDHIIDPKTAGVDSVKVPTVEPPGQPVCTDCGQQSQSSGRNPAGLQSASTIFKVEPENTDTFSSSSRWTGSAIRCRFITSRWTRPTAYDAS